MTEETREYLRKEGDPDADKKYFINEGYKLHFNNLHDKSIADIFDFNAEITPKDKNDPNDFIRYSQVLDTDYDNFLVLYQCFEIAEYRDQLTHRPISLKELQLKSSLSPLEFKVPKGYS